MTQSRIRSHALLILALTPLLARAKEAPPANRVSMETAREVALRTYPGKIKAEELEFEKGRWLYSFDLQKPREKVVHEIHVDALSGKLLDSHVETPADEEKEARDDAKKTTGQ